MDIYDSQNNGIGDISYFLWVERFFRASVSCTSLTLMGECQTEDACQWVSSDSSCIKKTTTDDTASSAAADDDDSVTCGSITRMGECQTSPACSWLGPVNGKASSPSSEPSCS